MSADSCTRSHKPIYKARGVRHRRTLARELLKRLAQFGPDSFTWHDAVRLTNEMGPGPYAYEDYCAFEFIRAHGFIRPLVQRKPGRVVHYELTEQAIRWLDWVGFDWMAVRPRAA